MIGKLVVGRIFLDSLQPFFDNKVLRVVGKVDKEEGDLSFLQPCVLETLDGNFVLISEPVVEHTKLLQVEISPEEFDMYHDLQRSLPVTSEEYYRGLSNAIRLHMASSF